MAFVPTAKQQEATELIAGPARHILLEGGGRSAKTFFFCWAIATRALIAPGSRHAILRFRFNHVITTIWNDTWPKMMKLCYPDVAVSENKSFWFKELPGGSQVWFGGLDDAERTDKILGNEYATILLNEVSQMGFPSVETVHTRLAQKVEFTDPLTNQKKILRLKNFYDQNPPNKGHWTYKIFHQGKLPDGRPLPHPEDYARLRINPEDNKENISPEYFRLMESWSAAKRRRFERGEYAEENPGALFVEEWIDRNRVIDGKVPEFVRIVVANDPSGSGDVDNADNDAIGIVAVGLGTDGKAYVMEDNTVKAGPATWGRVTASTYDRLRANVVIGEKNFGGAMVEFTIQTASKALGLRPIPFKYTISSRGKHIRAEPISALYEQGKVCHVGYFGELEEELCGFTPSGYTGSKSPNRADALIFALTELFPGIVKQAIELKKTIASPYRHKMGF